MKKKFINAKKYENKKKAISNKSRFFKLGQYKKDKKRSNQKRELRSMELEVENYFVNL